MRFDHPLWGRREPLTKRQKEVLRLLRFGYSDEEIAASLGISKFTVSQHVRNILLRLNAPNRVAAVAISYEEKMFPEEEE